MEKKCAWDNYGEKDLKKLNELCDEYKEFISTCKTERLCVDAAVKMAEKASYKNLKDIIAKRKILFLQSWKWYRRVKPEIQVLIRA